MVASFLGSSLRGSEFRCVRLLNHFLELEKKMEATMKSLGCRGGKESGN